MANQFKRNWIKSMGQISARRSNFILKVGTWFLFSNPNAYGNAVGSDFQLFSPNFSGIDFLSVEPSTTLAPGVFNFSGFIDVGTNVLPNIKIRDVTPSRTKIDDSLVSLQTQVGYGVLDHLELGLSLPMILAENSSSNNYRGQITSAGFSFFRMAAKYQFYATDLLGLAAIFDTGTSLMNNNPYTGEGSQTSYTTSLAIDAKFQDFSLGGNIGYKFRSVGTKVIDAETNQYPIEPIKAQLVWSSAARFNIIDDEKAVITELSGATALGQVIDDSDRGNSTSEILISYRQKLNESIQVYGGLGSEVVHGPGSAGLRAVIGASMSLSTTPIKDLIRERSESNSVKEPSSLPEAAPSFQPDNMPADSEFSEKDASFPVFSPDELEEVTVNDTSYELDGIKPKTRLAPKAKSKPSAKSRKALKKKK